MIDIMQPMAYQGKRDTSKEAADSIRPLSGKVRLKVYNFILGQGANGATLEEIANSTGTSLQSVCARRRELEDLGFVVDSGQRRRTKSLRSAIVWVISPERSAEPPKR